jgi:hypothetical protein
MSYVLFFWLIFFTLLLAIIYCDKKFGMLRDLSTEGKEGPFSWSRVQLAFWVLIVLSSISALFYNNGQPPTLDASTIILLGISAATTATARVIDVADQTNPNIKRRHQDEKGENFILDIISDETGASIHRFQAVAVNLIFGIGFIYDTLKHLELPVISNQYLALLGLSSATYAAIKTTENKVQPEPALKVATDTVDLKEAAGTDNSNPNVVVATDQTVKKEPVIAN